MLFLELVSGDFSVVFWGVREIICCSARYTGKVEADLFDDVTANCYDHQITTQVHVHVLSCIIFYKFVSQLKCFGIQSPGKDKGMYGSF